MQITVYWMNKIFFTEIMKSKYNKNQQIVEQKGSVGRRRALETR